MDGEKLEECFAQLVFKQAKAEIVQGEDVVSYIDRMSNCELIQLIQRALEE